MFSSILSSGLKFAGITLVIGSLLAFLSAPVFFGMVIITASVLMTVYTYTAIAFILGAILKWFKVRKGNDAINSN